MKKTLLIFGLIIVMSSFVLSDTMISLSTEEGYSNNIFNDSFAIADSYTTLSSDLLMYPTDMMEINLFGDYKMYSKTNGLSNLLGGASITLIPTDETMKSQIFLNGSFSFVDYGLEFDYYNYTVVSGHGSWNYQLFKNLITKLGSGVSSTSYTNTSSVTNNIFYLFGGLNTTFFSQNSFDIETAFYNKKFNTNDSFNSENSYVDLSLRYSRPICNSVGLRVLYLKRFLDIENGTYMDGFTIDYLSPWSTLWRGEDLGFTLKKIFPMQLVMSLSASYSEKEYIDQREIDEVGISSFNSRDDKSNSFSVQFQKDYLTYNSLIVPRLYVGFQNNNSSNELYSYDKLSLNGSISVSF